MVLQWTLSEEPRPGLLQDRPFYAAASVYILSMGDSEPPHIFQHQSTGYFRTRGQETLYDTFAACAI